MNPPAASRPAPHPAPASPPAEQPAGEKSSMSLLRNSPDVR